MTRDQLVVVAVFVVLAVAAAFALGWWIGRGRADGEVADLEEELERAIARQAPGRHRPDPLPVAARLEYLDRVDRLWEYAAEVVHTAPLAAPVLEPTEVIGPDWSVTAWTQAQAEEMDRWLAEHIGRTDDTLREITR